MNIKQVGVLGAGQLARMLALSGHPLGIRLVCVAPEETQTTEGLAGFIKYDTAHENLSALESLLRQTEVLTYETENVDVKFLRRLESLGAVLRPCVTAVEIAQDRYLEKNLFHALEIPVTPFVSVNSLPELESAAQNLGLPLVLKTRRFGYDGKGQYVIRNAQDIPSAYESLKDHDLIAEAFIPFDSEVSLIAVRNVQGDVQFYPLAENQHREGILRCSIAPFENKALQTQAEAYVGKLLHHLDYCGVLVVEFFQCGDQLIASEMAPRVHNSGHWTIEGATTSQFENHLRAILGFPLGETYARGFSAMVNCIGREPPLEKVVSIPNTHRHTYLKTPRAGRKVGHITVVESDKTNLLSRVAQVKALCQE